MNKEECINANWKIIGLQDGSRGKLAAYVGEHQSACSEYNITPNLELYMQGHELGVRQYCTVTNGYNLGKSGSSYNGVCPQSLEAKFLVAYNHGYENYQLNRQIQVLENSISSATREIDDLKTEVSELENKLISDGISKEQRESLLNNIKLCNESIRKLEFEIDHHHHLKEEIVETLFIHNQSH